MYKSRTPYNMGCSVVQCDLLPAVHGPGRIALVLYYISPTPESGPSEIGLYTARSRSPIAPDPIHEYDTDIPMFVSENAFFEDIAFSR